MCESRAMTIWAALPGSIWVRVAPTRKPQIVNSKLRLEKHLHVDPLIAGAYSKREGYIYEHKGAQIHFLSGSRTANVVGGTASIALSVDEAHKIDKDKFEEDFSPFTARTNAPTIMWGVAAAQQDMLYHYRKKLDGTDCVLELPAEVWCALSDSYAQHYANRVHFLGEDHPIIRTQYRLIDIESIGAYLNDAQRASLFAGDHPRLEAPRDGKQYFIVIDVGGESEVEASDAEIREEQPGRDSTMAWILEIDPTENTDPYPMIRIVSGVWWTGRSHLACVPEVITLARHWGVLGGVCDARGVGEALAMAIHKSIPSITPYLATSPEVSQDCYDLLARINTGRVRFWRADPAADEELREIQAQSRWTRYEIHGHAEYPLMRLAKPVGIGSSGKHIDGIKALTYIHRAVSVEYAGLLAYMRSAVEEGSEESTAQDSGKWPAGAVVS